MASLNKVFLIGNLTRDPELRYTAGGTAVADLNIAVNQKILSRSTNERRDEVVFVAVTVWGKQAEACGEYLFKGSSIFIEGRLQLDQWESKDGQKRNRLRVVAQRVQFIGRPRGADKAATQLRRGEETQTQDIPADVPLENTEDIGTEEATSGEGGEQVPF